MEYKPKIFLSGGFKSNWQAEVIKTCGDKFIFFNPREHGLEKPDFYTVWDIHFIKECDIVFAFMEISNPSGYGLALEVGLAHGYTKTIILVDERSPVDIPFSKYFKIVHESSNIVFDKFNNGLNYLMHFSKIN